MTDFGGAIKQSQDYNIAIIYISCPVVRAFAKKFKPLDILHFEIEGKIIRLIFSN